MLRDQDQKIEKELRDLTTKQQKLKHDYEVVHAAQEEMQRQKENFERRLNAAQRLISGFSSEKIRWTEDREKHKKEFDCLIGVYLLTAGLFSYLGPLNQEYRSKLLFYLCKTDLIDSSLPVTSDFALVSFLSDEAEIFNWKGEGLQADELSVRNGLLITRAQRFPLCIDPQLQVFRWITMHIGEKSLRTTSFQDRE